MTHHPKYQLLIALSCLSGCSLLFQPAEQSADGDANPGDAAAVDADLAVDANPDAGETEGLSQILSSCDDIFTDFNDNPAANQMALGLSGNTTVGLRFADVSIPPGSQILGASIIFTPTGTSQGSLTLTIRGHSIPDSPDFCTAPRVRSRLSQTSFGLLWTPTDWAIGPIMPETTPDLTEVLQEVISQPGWTVGSPLVFTIGASSGMGTALRVANSFEGSKSDAAILKFSYRP